MRRRAARFGRAAAFSAAVSLIAMAAPLAAEEAGAPSDDKAAEAGEETKAVDTPDLVCGLIGEAAKVNGLPDHFFARLIWKESRFDLNAVSPAGAEGVAQFMPATAKRRGLANPYDPHMAIPISAAYLAELREEFGNLGLAAAAYNAGEHRVRGYVAGARGLPAETLDYVYSITGRTADWFKEPGREAEDRPLDPKKPFAEACRDLPVIATRAVPRPPWGAVVAGGRNQRAAMAAFERARRRAPSLISAENLFFVRKPKRAAGPVVTARIGAESRAEALRVCRRVAAAGLPCVVRRR